MSIPTLIRRPIQSVITIALGALLAGALSASTDRLPYIEKLPPLLDREVFFGDPELTNSQVSPDGKHMTFMRPFEGVMNVWVKPIDASFDDARPLTADDRPVPGYFWSADSEFILYVQDKGGDENFHVYAVDPDGEVPEGSRVPEARNLTPLDGVRAQILAVPEPTPETILVGLNDRDPALHDVYSVNLASGERTLLIENTANVAGWSVDLDGNVRLAVRQTGDGGTEILRVSEGRLGDAVYTCSWLESCGPMRFHPDGERVWLISNKGDDVDLTSLYLMNAENGATEKFESDPEGEVDFSGALFSNADDELLATVYEGDRTRIYPKTERAERALAFLRDKLPDVELNFSPQTRDDRLVKVTASSDVDPGTVYLFDWEEYTLEKLYESRPEIPQQHMARMRPIRYEARDGLEIPAYLTTPNGPEEKNLALVALIHGGPWARDSWGYRSTVQFLANRGYAVLQPNFRGSTGYGKEFLNAGNNEWGEAMQDDISDGIKHLVDQGIVDPERVCIMGGSYGGYATLAGMTFTPELYNCGVDIVGPSNLITLLNSIPPYWGPIRKIFTLRMGNSETEEGRAQMERQSPLFHVENIQSPLLVIQGANDPRVKQAESDQIVIAMREKELPVEYIVAPDEGHGFRGLENRMAMYARIEAFLARHNGGRHQSDMPEAIEKRLEAIRVDVDSVEEPKIASGLDVARTLPLPPVDADRVRTGSARYSAQVSMGGQEMSIESSREIASEAGDAAGDQPVLVIRTSSRGAMGSASDVYELSARSMLPKTRRIEQGPATIEVEYGSDRVTGSIQAGQEIPIELQLDAPAYGADAALETAILAMNLDDGFSAPVRAVEIGMQHRVRIHTVTVQEAETIDVEAGEFETWRVRVEPMDGEGGGQTLWVTRETPRLLVRAETTLPPQMGGATIRSELDGIGDADLEGDQAARDGNEADADAG